MRLLSLRRLMTFSALIALPYGLLTVLFPGWWLGLIGGFHLEGSGLLMARMYGGQMVGFGTVSWLGRGAPDSPAKRALIQAFVVVDALSLGLASYGMITGAVGPEGWLDLLGFAFFVGGFGYYALHPE